MRESEREKKEERRKHRAKDTKGEEGKKKETKDRGSSLTGIWRQSEPLRTFTPVPS